MHKTVNHQAVIIFAKGTPTCVKKTVVNAKGGVKNN
jgi:hypothetical protein